MEETVGPEITPTTQIQITEGPAGRVLATETAARVATESTAAAVVVVAIRAVPAERGGRVEMVAMEQRSGAEKAAREDTGSMVAAKAAKVVTVSQTLEETEGRAAIAPGTEPQVPEAQVAIPSRVGVEMAEKAVMWMV